MPTNLPEANSNLSLSASVAFFCASTEVLISAIWRWYSVTASSPRLVSAVAAVAAAVAACFEAAALFFSASIAASLASKVFALATSNSPSPAFRPVTRPAPMRAASLSAFVFLPESNICSSSVLARSLNAFDCSTTTGAARIPFSTFICAPKASTFWRAVSSSP
ncbi:hypothetical protein D3C76_911040 [compost metagenome]